MCLNLFFKKQEIIVPIPIPESETIECDRQGFINTMKSFGINSLTGSTPMDSVVRLASKVELDRIAPELVYPAEWYISDLYDCDDYGLQAQLDAGRKFEITVRLGLGKVDSQYFGYPDTGDLYHGFAITLDRDLNLWILEPNAGFEWAGVWFKYGENTYRPDKVFI